MKEILGDRAHVSTPILSMTKKVGGNSTQPTYELFTTDSKSVGVFDEVIFACHTPTTKEIIESMKLECNTELVSLLSNIEYGDNLVYVHSDSKLMPLRRHAWTSWNCLGKSRLLNTFNIQKSKRKEAMEGADSGFGNKASKVQIAPAAVVIDDSSESPPVDVPLDGEEGRMKAVYVTYWLNRLQNLDVDTDIFVSLNPHQKPDPALTYHCYQMAHPQYTFETLKARKTLENEYQGKDGLWFAGAWAGYGFHEDGCRSGFEAATKLSGIPLPWASESESVLAPPDFTATQARKGFLGGWLSWLRRKVYYDLPVSVCKRLCLFWLQKAIKHGLLQLKMNDGTVLSFGDGTPCGSDDSPVTLRVFDEWMFVKLAWEYDLGLARSYMAGYFLVEPLKDPKHYNSITKPMTAFNETNGIIGDPVGLTRFFLLALGNRDWPGQIHTPGRSSKGYSGANAINAGLLLSKIGSFLNFLRYRLTMDNSERGGSLKNIHAHYDLSNDLFTSFLDRETLMYSSAIYDAVKAPSGQDGLVFRGSLEEAQWRKLNTLLERAQVKPGQKLLDIGFGWGGLSLLAAKKYGCRVTGITLSIEQKALAEKRVKKAGLGHLINFEVIDYRVFARRKDNLGKFDRVVSCEMIEAVGHDHLVEFYWAVEQVLAPNGILVMEAITATEERYEVYRRTTDFINTIIFPGGLCPSLHALVDAAYKGSRLSLENIDNIGLHYAETLREWRRRFNSNEKFVRSLGFDDIFFRVWNYYMSYCEAGFVGRSVNCLILVFARQGCKDLAPLFETRSVTQPPALTDEEIAGWISEAE